MKYIMYESPSQGYVPILFPATMSHNEINRVILNEWPGFVPVTAGEVKLNDNKEVVAFGHSQTLKLQSQPDDSVFISIALRS